jgi:TPR repeat protein
VFRNPKREGIGERKDAVRAVGWFQKAAQQGNPKAQLCLGIMYCNGEGVPKDLVESYAWLNLAAVYDPEAAGHRGTLEKSMPTTQVAEGQARSRDLARQIEARKQGN